MNRLKLSICAAGAMTAFITLGTLQPRPAASQGNGVPEKDVRVINTAAQPVPVSLNGTGTVKGDVNVVNTPTVNVGNTPGVNILNAPTVKLDTTQPVPVVEASSREPFQFAVKLEDSGAATGLNSFTVPAGKMLVIEYVSAWMNKRGGVYIGPSGTLSPEITLPIQTTINDFGGGISDRYGASEQVRFYAEGLQRVISETDPRLGSDYFGELTVVGYLIPAE